MKKYIFLVIALCAIVVISCKKDSSPTALILGKWFFVEQTDDVYNRTTLTAHADKTTFDPASYYEFNKDGSLIYNQENNSSGILVNWRYQLFASDSIQINQTMYVIKKLTSTSLVIHTTGGDVTNRHETEVTMKHN